MNFKYQLIFSIKRLYWFLFRPRSYGIKCILENDGRILMIRRTFGTDKWVFPGGAIRAGEDAQVAARREIQEDPGAALAELRGLGSFTQTVHYRQETIHCFSAQVLPESIHHDKEKILEIGWFQPLELPELTPISKSVMALYKA